MKSILLIGPALDAAGKYRDSGDTLTIGDDVDADGAQALIDAQRAVAVDEKAAAKAPVAEASEK